MSTNDLGHVNYMNFNRRLTLEDMLPRFMYVTPRTLPITLRCLWVIRLINRLLPIDSMLLSY